MKFRLRFRVIDGILIFVISCINSKAKSGKVIRKMEKEVMKSAVLEVIKRRRSTRAFLKDPVPENILNEIIEAGRLAPSASNTQLTSFYVITNPEKLAEIKAAMTVSLAGMQEEESMPAPIKARIKLAKEGKEVDVIYGAPAVIVTANKKGAPTSNPDCSCCLMNMMLTACANDVANVWINQFFQFSDAPAVRSIFTALGLANDEDLFGALALGYAETIESTPLPRTGFAVKYIR